MCVQKPVFVWWVLSRVVLYVARQVVIFATSGKIFIEEMLRRLARGVRSVGVITCVTNSTTALLLEKNYCNVITSFCYCINDVW